MPDTYVYVLTKGTHDDKHILGVFANPVTAKDVAQHDYNNHRGPLLTWEGDDTGWASEWDRFHPDPYRVERWEVID